MSRQRDLEKVEKATQRTRNVVKLSWFLAGLVAAFLLAGFTYVKTFLHLSFTGDLLRSEQSVRIIYSPEQLKEAFRNSPVIHLMREAQEQSLTLSNKLFSLEQEINQMVKSKSAEKGRLLKLSDQDLINEFPNETKALAAVPEDKPAVVRERRPAYALDTKELARALNVSYAKALELKYDSGPPEVTSYGVFFAEERKVARSAAIQTIMTRFEDDLLKKNGMSEAALGRQADGLRELLATNHKTKIDLQQDALNKIRSFGIERPVNSSLHIRRKPCLLIFEQHGWLFELQADKFEVALDASHQGEFSFFDYLLVH